MKTRPWCERDTMAAIAEQLERAAHAAKCEVVATMLGDPHAARLQLWRHGFLRSPAVFSVILNRLSERARSKVDTNPEHWNLMWIDSDDL